MVPARVPRVDQAAVELLTCPHCGGALRENGGSLICSKGHTLNIARQGYVSMLGRDAGTHTADTVEMVAARERVLASGAFRPLAEVLASIAGEAGVGSYGVESAPGTAVVDLGSGTGYYLAAVLDALPGRIGIGVDNSKFAARRTAKSNERAFAIVADIWDEIPIRDGAAGLMLNVFSPRNGEEMERILAPGGTLIVVTPQAGHLAELIEPFGMISVDPDKEERLERSLGAFTDGTENQGLEWKMSLGPERVRDLVEMGPSAGRMAAAEMEGELAKLDQETEVTAAVTITVVSREHALT